MVSAVIVKSDKLLCEKASVRKQSVQLAQEIVLVSTHPEACENFANIFDENILAALGLLKDLKKKIVEYWIDCASRCDTDLRQSENSIAHKR